MSETPRRRPKNSVREIVGLSLAMLLGFGGILVGEPPYPLVFVMAATASGALIFAAYWGGRVDSAREFEADLDAALTKQTGE